jgi:hypothetical protein
VQLRCLTCCSTSSAVQATPLVDNLSRLARKHVGPSSEFESNRRCRAVVLLPLYCCCCC